MTPTFSNSSPSPYFAEFHEDHQLIFSPNLQAPSSSSLSCHAFFDSNYQDQSGICHGQIQYQHDHEDETLASHGGSDDLENENNNGLKFSLWKKIDANEGQSEYTSIKWMSSKMRLMKKMKNSDGTAIEVPKITTTSKLEGHDQKQTSISPMDTDNSSNSSNSHNSNNIPVRVCADCNTTKTPLWRGGPTGPKSLCNACGIRQRKARRAMAAAAAAAAENGTIIETTNTSTKKMKLQKKDKRSNNGHVAKIKKRSKLLMTSSPSQSKKKLCFEDLLINLSKNLAFHRLFPQDEKEAAILLMALSCGLVHG